MFCDKCGTRLVETEPAAPPKLEDMQKQLQSRIPQSLADRLFAGAKQMQGEYRLVTAVFADVVGSSGMARDMPLEQYVDAMNDCFKMMVDTISIKYEGSINRFIGDCVLAFFGAPIAHENDAERAILAALDIRDNVKELRLNISIGINTGMTYVGEMGSDLIYSERSAWGPDVDFTKRLQDAAEPGQILVGASTYRVTNRAYDFAKPIYIEVKGMEKPQVAYPVLHIREHPEKLRGIEGLRARMIGREREFADLKESADDLVSGKGSIVTVIGEAGIGKSRLVSELKDYINVGTQHAVSLLEGRSVSLGQTISYWPFLDMLKTYLNLSDTDSESEIAGKLRESITDLFPQGWEDILPFMGNLLSIKFSDELDDKLAYFTPEQIRHQTLMRLKGLFTTISRRKPLLLILEDLHWADDLSLDLVSLLMDDLAENPLMLLCIYRPERSHRCWQIGEVASRKCLERYTEITLKKLSAVQSRQLVESLLTIENLPEPTKDMILRKSEGNPFFIEEVIRSLIDRDLVYREDDRWKARREIEDIDVPDTIQSVLLSRVDRLQAETRYVLQCASVIGRLFRYRLLDHLAQHERDLEEHLSQLEERELIHEERSVPELEYAFKHALTQEATYQGILERKRQEFHQQVGEGIESLYRDRIEEYYEELAHHYVRSADKEKALEYLIKAGDKSKGIYANQQAIDYYTRAMDLTDQFPEKREQKLSILEGLGDVYNLIGKPDEAFKSYESALNCSDERRRRADIYRKIANVYGSKLQPDLVLKYVDIAIEELGEDTNSVEMARIYNTAMGMYLNIPWSGHDFDKALDYGFKSLSIIEGTEHKRELAWVYSNLGDIYTTRSDYDNSIQYEQKALTIAQEIGDVDLLGGIHWSIGWIYLVKAERKTDDEWEMAVEHFKKCIEFYKKAGSIQNLAIGYMFAGYTYYCTKDYEPAIKYYKTSIEIDEERKFPVSTGRGLVYLSRIYRDKGEWDEAIKYAQEGLHIGTTVGRNDSMIAPGACQELIQAYLAKGELDKVLYYTKESVNLLINQSNSVALAQTLSSAEDIYEKMNKSTEFISFCREIMEKNAEKLKGMKLTQWYLEPKELSGQFTQTFFLDEFDVSVLNPRWQWIDPKADCQYELNIESSQLEIRASSDCDLWWTNLNAPRLLQDISGDFAIETKIAPAGENITIVGGLLVWKDKDNFIRFERGMHGTNEIGLSGNIKGEFGHFGRGVLASETIYLRIERIGDTLSAYCSKDDENWLTCGEVGFPVGDPIQVGIHAIGSIGARGGLTATVTRFDYFRVLRRTP
jgi:class 3 adenylate cyclase/tetratricopeptide (TPR) repeat protein